MYESIFTTTKNSKLRYLMYTLCFKLQLASCTHPFFIMILFIPSHSGPNTFLPLLYPLAGIIMVFIFYSCTPTTFLLLLEYFGSIFFFFAVKNHSSTAFHSNFFYMDFVKNRKTDLFWGTDIRHKRAYVNGLCEF